MKKNIKYLLLFITPIVLFSYSIDLFISKYLKKSNVTAIGEYSVWNDVFDGKINSDVVIYGSSRAWVHISPKILSNRLDFSIYNLGINGHNFCLQYLRHKELLKFNMKPKLIILSLDYLTLEKQKDLYNSDQFLPYMLWNNDIKEATISYNGFSFLDYQIPLVRYYGQLQSIYTANSIFINCAKNPLVRIKGYEGAKKTWNGDFDKAKLTMKNYEIKCDSVNVALFKKFLNECKSKDIKLIFVYTPEYIEGQRFIKNRTQLMGIYKKFSEQYKIPFYDYSNDSICYQKKYFYNAGHMNDKGAELFTKKFADTLFQSKIIKELKKK